MQRCIIIEFNGAAIRYNNLYKNPFKEVEIKKKSL